MKKNLKKLAFIVGVASSVALVGTMAQAQMKPPFGTPDEVAYSKDIWSAMVKAKLAGPGAIWVRPYEGNHPHGAIQQVLDTKITVRGRSARIIVKRNFGGKKTTVQSIYDNPNAKPGAVTVMFKRKKGYDPADLDWMWIKFKADGSLHKNPKGMMLAGKVAKGKEKGCIACHKAAGGADLETLTEK